MIESVARDSTEPYQCTPGEAVNLVRKNPFSVIERLSGAGSEEDLNQKWRLMGIGMDRGREMFDVEFGTDVSMDIDEDTFIGLIMRTKDIYMAF
jgi:hypothetical protein